MVSRSSTGLTSGLSAPVVAWGLARRNVSDRSLLAWNVLSLGLLTYGAVGFSLMYPGEAYHGGWFGFGGFGIGTDASGLTIAYADGAYTYWTDFLFQAMFAATAATIVSGAVAERIKLGSFMVGATVLVLVGYPITGSWEWGGGWLNSGPG